MKHYVRAALCIGTAGALAACVPTQPPQAGVASPVADRPVAEVPPAPAPQTVQTGSSVTGTASWYHSSSQLQRTASGQMLNNNAMTAASAVIPMGTKVRVGRLNGSQSVVVVVNDRMPPNHRLIDVSASAANKLGLKTSGVAKVTVTPVASAAAP